MEFSSSNAIENRTSEYVIRPSLVIATQCMSIARKLSRLLIHTHTHAHVYTSAHQRHAQLYSHVAFMHVYSIEVRLYARLAPTFTSIYYFMSAPKQLCASSIHHRRRHRHSEHFVATIFKVKSPPHRGLPHRLPLTISM